MIVWGVGLGGFWIMIYPVSGDVIDNSIVLTEKREEGIYTGFQMFFGRLGIIAQALTFVIVHTLTGFSGVVGKQTDLAIFGIHLHTSIIPAIFLYIGVLVFWKFYDLTPEKIENNQLQLERLKL